MPTERPPFERGGRAGHHEGFASAQARHADGASQAVASKGHAFAPRRQAPYAGGKAPAFRAGGRSGSRD